MARAKKWSDLSKSTRERYYALATGPPFHMSQSAARHAYNRGTWNPGSPDAIQRVPRKFRDTDLADMAFINARSHLGDRARWQGERSDDEIERNIHHASDVALAAMAHATENELVTWAQAGSKPELSDSQREREALKAHPGWHKEDVGYFDSRSNWHSVFWYHAG